MQQRPETQLSAQHPARSLLLVRLCTLKGYFDTRTALLPVALLKKHAVTSQTNTSAAALTALNLNHTTTTDAAFSL